MTDKNGYNYQDFLNDSSDDYPKYADGIDLEPQTEIIKEVLGCDYPPPTNLIALENVLSLAEERIGEFQSPNYTDAEIVIADDSILAVKAMLNLMKAGADLKTLEASNIALAKDDNPHEGRA